MVLTKAGSILGPIATVLGYVMDILFRFTSSFGVFNVGLCIILFTIVMKTLMIPLTIKQQKTTKLMSVMNPEIQAIQKKYKGKSDQESRTGYLLSQSIIFFTRSRHRSRAQLVFTCP